jgi:hypothetical protein
MSFEWIGAATFAAGILCLLHGRRLAIFVFLVSTLFGAAAASVLTALGSANLPPSHLLLGFLMLIAARGVHFQHVMDAFAPSRAGIWLLLTLCYAFIVVLFMPRIMAGATDVFSITRSDSGAAGLVLTPLAPSGGNLTQTAYFIGDVACYGIFCAFARDRAGKRWIADALLLCGCVNILFAALDYLTFFTQTGDYLAFMRNATYRIFDTAEVVGLKRLIGSFPEASAFASMTLTLFAFCVTLWLNGYRPALAGPVALVLLVALVLSTSTTAYVSLTIYLAIVFAGSMWRVLKGQASRIRVRALIATPLLACLAIGAISLDGTLTNAIDDLLNQLVFQKGTTDSAIERGSWNSQALINFLDSHGIGLGVGSVRASSFAVASLATIGVLGTLSYGLFFLRCLAAPREELDPESRAIREAAASACLSLFISGTLAGTTIDLGLMFFACAGLAAAPATLALQRSTTARSAQGSARIPQIASRAEPGRHPTPAT